MTGGACVALGLLLLGGFAIQFVWPLEDQAPEESEEPLEEWAPRVAFANGFRVETVAEVLEIIGNREDAEAICEACALVAEDPVSSAKTIAELNRRLAAAGGKYRYPSVE